MKKFAELPPQVQEELKKSTRALFIRTYANEECLNSVIIKHNDSISSCAYILHDQDKAVPHRHVVLLLERSRRMADIYGWFASCVDDKNEECNTEVEEVLSMNAVHEYLTHSDEKSRQEGKHQYAEEDIVYPKGNNPWDYKTAKDKAFEAKEKKDQYADENEQLLQDIIDGVSFREMARKYGRDYMKNYKQYRAFASQVVLEETGDFEMALKLMNDLTEQYRNEEKRMAYENGVITAITRITNVIESDSHLGQLAVVLKQLMSSGNKKEKEGKKNE